MWRLALVVCCIVAIPLHAQGEDFQTRVLVTVPEGVAVANLAISNIQVEQDGREANDSSLLIQHDIPLRIGIVLDESGSARRSPLYYPFLLERVLDWAAATLARYGGDAFLVGFNDEIVVSTEIVPQISELRRALSQLHPIGGSAVRDAIVHSSRKFHSLGPEAKPTARVLVLVSDGLDNASWSKERNVIESAQMNEVRVYAISFPSREAAAGKSFLEDVCGRTGGKALFPQHETAVGGVLSALDRDLANSFLISFVPEARDGRWHDLSVKLSDIPKADLRYTHKFYAPTER